MTPFKFISRRLFFVRHRVKRKQLFKTTSKVQILIKISPFGCYLLLGFLKNIQMDATAQV
jgi:hypothetical protein